MSHRHSEPFQPCFIWTFWLVLHCCLLMTRNHCQIELLFANLIFCNSFRHCEGNHWYQSEFAKLPLVWRHFIVAQITFVAFDSRFVDSMQRNFSFHNSCLSHINERLRTLSCRDKPDWWELKSANVERKLTGDPNVSHQKFLVQHRLSLANSTHIPYHALHTHAQVFHLKLSLQNRMWITVFENLNKVNDTLLRYSRFLRI